MTVYEVTPTVSTDVWDGFPGIVVGGADCLATDDGDTSYVQIDNVEAEGDGHGRVALDFGTLDGFDQTEEVQITLFLTARTLIGEPDVIITYFDGYHPEDPITSSVYTTTETDLGNDVDLKYALETGEWAREDSTFGYTRLSAVVGGGDYRVRVTRLMLRVSPVGDDPPPDDPPEEETINSGALEAVRTIFTSPPV